MRFTAHHLNDAAYAIAEISNELAGADRLRPDDLPMLLAKVGNDLAAMSRALHECAKALEDESTLGR